MLSGVGPGLSPLEQGIIEGENPVCGSDSDPTCGNPEESGRLGMRPQMGGKLHLKLNTGERPIAKKYRGGKMQRTLKRELKSA